MKTITKNNYAQNTHKKTGFIVFGSVIVVLMNRNQLMNTHRNGKQTKNVKKTNQRGLQRLFQEECDRKRLFISIIAASALRCYEELVS